MNDLIECRTMKGDKKSLPKDKLKMRPSVYGIVMIEGKVLLTKMRSTGKYGFPGGGVDLGETLEEALKREMWEECGIEVDVLTQVYFKENFFYYEPSDSAWQAYLFFYSCRAKSFELTRHDVHDESIDPQWIDIPSLKASDFQAYGEAMVALLQTP